MFLQKAGKILLTGGFLLLPLAAHAAPVPGYVPPVTYDGVPDYADDTRGVYVPNHSQHRLRSERELYGYDGGGQQLAQLSGDAYERTLNNLSTGYGDMDYEMNRIASDPGMVEQGGAPAGGQMPAYVPPVATPMAGSGYAPAPAPYATGPVYGGGREVSGGGVEVAVGQVQRKTLDMTNSLVRLREDRISVRRALQRMMDQIGGGDWAVIWDLAEQNAGLPEMEISLYAEEPFSDVLNALLARLQTRSGQPLRVIRYDNTQRLVITDRVGGHRLLGKTSPIGVDGAQPAVTEQVLKEAMVTLHYDEIPLVDALENMVNQAGKGEWRLRMYAGLDQVLKPAHVEEPFAIGMERVLRLFNLKYEVFPGGKLVVVTHNNKFGFPG